MDKIKKKNEIMPFLSPGIRGFVKNFNDEFWNGINGIRLTVGMPIIAELNGECVYVGKCGTVQKSFEAYNVTDEDIRIITELITNSSMYSYSRYINECFLTLPGGNRAGIVGECVIENNRITNVKNIYSIYMRISSEKKNCSKLFFDEIYNERVYNTLIISPPGCGKTTVLRDICYQLSNINKHNIIIGAIIDERFELGCAYNGEPTVDVGINNFIISGCPKDIAIPLVVRSMAPDVILADELDAEKDFNAVKCAVLSGCRIVATTHGSGIQENRTMLYKNNIFEKYIVLSKRNGPGTLEQIHTEVLS